MRQLVESGVAPVGVDPEQCDSVRRLARNGVFHLALDEDESFLVESGEVSPDFKDRCNDRALVFARSLPAQRDSRWPAVLTVVAS